MQEKKTAETDEAFKGVDAFTKFFAENYWDKTTNVIFDLAHGWAHWIANMWGMMANQGQMKYKGNRRQFEHDLGRFMDRDGNPVTPWMANKTRSRYSSSRLGTSITQAPSRLGKYDAVLREAFPSQDSGEIGSCR